MNEATMITPESTPTRIGVAFCQILRGLGLKVPVSRVTFFLEALGKVGLEDRDAVYWAGRSTLVADPEEIGDFDRPSKSFGSKDAHPILKSSCRRSQYRFPLMNQKTARSLPRITRLHQGLRSSFDIAP